MRNLWKRICYQFDRIMSSGPLAMCGLLFAATALIVVILSILSYFASGEGSLLSQSWNTLLFTLDAGNIAGVPTDNLLYVLLMFLATLCGIFLTSVLIGIINNGVESRVRDLRKGNSIVQEHDHTVIIGFDNNLYAILRELIEANSNHKNCCVVVLGEQPKEEMEDAIAAHIPHTRTTRIICRSGGLHEVHSLERCSIETCRSVIINHQEDAETVKILLALSSHLSGKQLTNPELRFVATLQDSQYVESAVIAGEGRSEIIYAKSAIARIIANTCRQHGLSQVMTELFNFIGNELYFEHVPELTGRTFQEATLSFSNAIAAGICKEGKVQLNPDMATVITKDDWIVLLERDDGAYLYHAPKAGAEKDIRASAAIPAQANDHLIVLGSNDKLPIILAEYEKYVQPGTRVVIADDALPESNLGTYENLQIEICKEPITRKLLCRFLDQHSNNLLLLNDDSTDPETSDSQTLLRLILLRDIADTTGRTFAITTEMRSVDNQRLAYKARVDDFVIGSNFSSLLMAQVSENPKMHPLIAELLDENGSELYMKPASNYVALGVPVDSYTLTQSAAQKGEIYLGYRKNKDGNRNVIVNPEKNQLISFDESDQLVVIATH